MLGHYIFVSVLLVLCFSVQQGTCGTMKSFSIGKSQVRATTSEQVLLDYKLSPTGRWGVINNWWLGGPQDSITLSFYIDGETNASVVVSVPQACGSGFEQSPGFMYTSAFFAKLAKDSGWTNKFPIPFQKSVKVTFKGTRNDVAWLWVRGVENLPLMLSGVQIPSNARLAFQKVEGTFAPLQFVDLVSVPAGQEGLLLATSLTVISPKNLNVLEGCFYLFPSAATTWENGATAIATGTEDYFESAYYFDGGPVGSLYSGATIMDRNGPDNANRVSMYKIHGENDPLVFSDGFKLTWRVGDQNDAQGLKCTCFPGKSGCSTNQDPQASTISSYAWVYVWPSTQLPVIAQDTL